MIDDICKPISFTEKDKKENDNRIKTAKIDYYHHKKKMEYYLKVVEILSDGKIILI